MLGGGDSRAKPNMQSAFSVLNLNNLLPWFFQIRDLRISIVQIA